MTPPTILPGVQVVENLSLVINKEMPRLAKSFNEIQGFGLSDFMSEMRDQITHQLLFVTRSGCRWLAPMCSTCFAQSFPTATTGGVFGLA